MYSLIEKYGVVLSKLTLNDIEMVRVWRNHPKIQQFMSYREHITPEMQEKWFDKISNEFNYYFIVTHENDKIGMIFVKDIDYTTMTGESGFFIWDDESLNNTISFRADLAIHDFKFETLNFTHCYGHALKTNKRSQRYSKFLGYELQPQQEDAEDQLYILKKEVYYERRAVILAMMGL